MAVWPPPKMRLMASDVRLVMFARQQSTSTSKTSCRSKRNDGTTRIGNVRKKNARGKDTDTLVVLRETGGRARHQPLTYKRLGDGGVLTTGRSWLLRPWSGTWDAPRNSSSCVTRVPLLLVVGASTLTVPHFIIRASRVKRRHRPVFDSEHNPKKKESDVLLAGI